MKIEWCCKAIGKREQGIGFFTNDLGLLKQANYSLGHHNFKQREEGLGISAKLRGFPCLSKLRKKGIGNVLIFTSTAIYNQN